MEAYGTRESAVQYERFETDAESDADETDHGEFSSDFEEDCSSSEGSSSDDGAAAADLLLGEQQIRPAPDVHGATLRTPVANPWQHAVLVVGVAALVWHLQPSTWAFFASLVVALAYFPVVGGALSAVPTINSPLYNAALSGDTERVELLLARGCWVHTGRHLKIPCIGRLLYNKSPLAVAAEHGRANCMRVLLSAGASPHFGESLGPLGTIRRTSPLFIAAAEGHAECVSILLGPMGGANPNLGLQKGPWGLLTSTTPLYVAAEDGANETTAALESLVEAGAGLNAGLSVGPFGAVVAVTPLFTACEDGHLPSVEALVALGATIDLGSRNLGGWLMAASPLWAAVQQGYGDVTKVLLEAGADEYAGETFCFGMAGSGAMEIDMKKMRVD